MARSARARALGEDLMSLYDEAKGLREVVDDKREDPGKPLQQLSVRISLTPSHAAIRFTHGDTHVCVHARGIEFLRSFVHLWKHSTLYFKAQLAWYTRFHTLFSFSFSLSFSSSFSVSFFRSRSLAITFSFSLSLFLSLTLSLSLDLPLPLPLYLSLALSLSLSFSLSLVLSLSH